MASDNSHAPNTESESRPSAIQTLRRFFFVAWHASPFGAIAQAFLTLVHGCIPIGVLWASRGIGEPHRCYSRRRNRAESTDRSTLGGRSRAFGDSQKPRWHLGQLLCDGRCRTALDSINSMP